MSYRHTAILRLLCILIIVFLAVSCVPNATQQTSPAASTALPTRTTSTATQPTPQPTDTAIPLAGTQPPSGAPQPDFTVCDQEAQGLPVGATPSPEAGISVEVDRLIPPAPPARVEAVVRDGNVLVTWQGTGTDVDQFYQVYLREEESECWQLIGIVEVEAENEGEYSFDAPMTEQPANYTYAVTTVDIYGNQSDLSALAKIGSDS
ncbi:MAG TPA: hypothetical protein VFZ76_09640 [Anaerolineales bacterium]